MRLPGPLRRFSACTRLSVDVPLVFVARDVRALSGELFEPEFTNEPFSFLGKDPEEGAQFYSSA